MLAWGLIAHTARTTVVVVGGANAQRYFVAVFVLITTTFLYHTTSTCFFVLYWLQMNQDATSSVPQDNSSMDVVEPVADAAKTDPKEATAASEVEAGNTVATSTTVTSTSATAMANNTETPTTKDGLKIKSDEDATGESAPNATRETFEATTISIKKESRYSAGDDGDGEGEIPDEEEALFSKIEEEEEQGSSSPQPHSKESAPTLLRDALKKGTVKPDDSETDEEKKDELKTEGNDAEAKSKNLGDGEEEEEGEKSHIHARVSSKSFRTGITLLF